MATGRLGGGGLVQSCHVRVARVLPRPSRTRWQGATGRAASALASAVAVEEVASWMEKTGFTSFRFFETFLVAACVHLVLCQAVNLPRLGGSRMRFRAEASR